MTTYRKQTAIRQTAKVESPAHQTSAARASGRSRCHLNVDVRREVTSRLTIAYCFRLRHRKSRPEHIPLRNRAALFRACVTADRQVMQRKGAAEQLLSALKAVRRRSCLQALACPTNREPPSEWCSRYSPEHSSPQSWQCTHDFR